MLALFAVLFPRNKYDAPSRPPYPTQQQPRRRSSAYTAETACCSVAYNTDTGCCAVIAHHSKPQQQPRRRFSAYTAKSGCWAVVQVADEAGEGVVALEVAEVGVVAEAAAEEGGEMKRFHPQTNWTTTWTPTS